MAERTCNTCEWFVPREHLTARFGVRAGECSAIGEGMSGPEELASVEVDGFDASGFLAVRHDFGCVLWDAIGTGAKYG